MGNIGIILAVASGAQHHPNRPAVMPGSDALPYFDPNVWLSLPFHFWSLAFFTFGCIVGSFLNVCIHRMPRGESLVSPPSHCPHCGYSIPWYLNIPLLTWLYLRGQCANCRAPISVRYIIVELFTGVMFWLAWILAGHQSVGLALVYCLIFAGLIVATFIDFEHFIIPDEITIGGTAVGVICSVLVPALHGVYGWKAGLQQSLIGAAVGAGIIYLIVRVGKMLIGRRRIELPPESRIIFTENAIVLPNQEIAYEEIFYRKTDTIRLHAKTVELVDRCYQNVAVRLLPDKLFLNDEQLNPEEIPHMEVMADQVNLPREVMGLGDVKFMAAIGAFLGWQAVLFSLMLSSILGAIVGVILIALKKQEFSSRLPYGPYIAMAAICWIIAGREFLQWWFSGGWMR